MSSLVYPFVAFRALAQPGDTPWFGVFPNLPGCFTAADSLEDLAAAAAEAAGLYLEDMPRRALPAATPFAEVEPRAVAEAAGIAAEGAEPVAVLSAPVPIPSRTVERPLGVDEGPLGRLDQTDGEADPA